VNISVEDLWKPLENLGPVQTVEAKKTYLNLYVSPRIKEILERQAAHEDRTLSNLCERLLTWSAKFLEEAGDSQVLLTWEARHTPKASKRVSEELQSQLHSALDLLFERAPSAVVERLAEYLTARAGKYGDEK
jgi:hypothetical protein